jgi:hypothetical protein
MLWSAIGGNVSRLSGITVYSKKEVSIAGCPSDWNITLPTGNVVENSQSAAQGFDW